MKAFTCLLRQLLELRVKSRPIGSRVSLLLVLVSLCAPATMRAQWFLDGFDPNANDQVYAVAVQPDGKIVVGGNFTSVAPNGGPAVTRNHLARFNADGTLDTFFDPNLNSTVFAIVLHPDGRILVGGSFTQVSPNGGATAARNRIARLNSDGTLDGLFNPNANQTVFAIAVQSDGKILAGGYFNGANSIGGQARNNIARLDAATGLADSFDPHAMLGIGSGPGPIYTIAIQTDGKILAGGDFRQIGGQVRRFIARLDPATGLPDSFNANADATVRSISLQADGKILLGGDFVTVGGQSRYRLARLDPATALADSFDSNNLPGSGAQGTVTAIQADGKVLFGSQFQSIGGQSRNRIARLDSVTGLPDSFDPNANDLVRAIAIQADGKIIMGGAFTTIGGQTRKYIARMAAPQLQIISGEQQANGHIILQCLGMPNQVNDLQASPDLNQNFTTVSPPPPAADANGVFQYEDDVTSAGVTKRFYRLFSSPPSAGSRSPRNAWLVSPRKS